MFLAAVRKLNLKALAQALVKIVDPVEILATIMFRLAHLANIDQIEDNLTKITGRPDSPMVQNGLGQQAELLECIMANRFT